MRYISTRGGMPPCGFTDILLGGLAPDGGLVVPEQIPVLDSATLAMWRKLSYPELAFGVISRFATDIEPGVLRALIARTYTAEVFGSAAITPLSTLEAAGATGSAGLPGSPAQAGALHLLHLSNGPTLAFKDVAMQLLGSLFEHVLRERGQSLNILGATSGDTGSAAEYAMRGRAGMSVVMLSPDGRMSAFQRAQMYSLLDSNIHNIAVRGVFDDCQDLVKAISGDAAFKARHRIGTVNSINWARIVAQVVYYFHGYFAATTANDQRVSFAVPTGNFGNVLAGHIARCMGLPVARLVVATNENDVLDEFFRTGHYRVRSSAQTHATSSPSMDISKASNFERFIFDLTGRDPERTRALYARLDAQGAFDLSTDPAWRRVVGTGFVSGSSHHALRMQVIRDLHARTGVLIDTHTADGLAVAQQHREPGVPMICLETARPEKFGETIALATGQAPALPAHLADLPEKVQRYTLMPADLGLLKQLIVARTPSAAATTEGA